MMEAAMSKSLVSVTADDFEPHSGEVFRLNAPNGEIELKLVEVQRLGQAHRDGGAFSLQFRAPAGPIVPQAIYPLHHPTLGTLELFMVPLGARDGANRYEVIFT
jgi:hypothetical protein